MWKDKANEVIAQVVRDVGTADETALKQALSKAYPFGERRMHPYKVWCEQVRKTLAGIRLQKTRNSISVLIKKTDATERSRPRRSYREVVLPTRYAPACGLSNGIFLERQKRA